MTLDELKKSAENAIEFAEKNGCEPLVCLHIPRFSNGHRIRIAKGLTGVIAQVQEEPPMTVCYVSAHKILKVIKMQDES